MTSHTPLRRQPLRVGLATQSQSSLHVDQTTPPCDDYDARIMHRVVPATLHVVTVLVDASDYQIARALKLQPRDVRNSWITSRTPLVDPRPPRQPTTLHPCAPTMERRYRMHTPMVPLQVLQKYRDMAVLLRRRLAEFHDKSNPEQFTQPSTKRAHHDTSTVASIAPSSADSNVGIDPSSSVICPTFGSKCCAFSHHGKRIRFNGDDHQSIVRTNGGLYSGARHSRLLKRGDSAYSEFVFSADSELSGVAVGVAHEKYGLDTMVGAKAGSMALHSQPKFVIGGKWNDPQRDTAPLKAGDIVGVLVSVSTSGVVMRVTVNGMFVGEMIGDEGLCNAVNEGTGVQVMVSMLRCGTSVKVRCCSSDWTHSPMKISARSVPPLCAAKNGGRNNKRVQVAVDDMSAVLTP